MKRLLLLLPALGWFVLSSPHAIAQQTQADQLNKLTVNFSHMSPHVGQDVFLAVIEADTRTELRRVHRTGELEFVVEIDQVLEDGKSYHVDFYADNNKNGYYDPPSTDHAWRLLIEDSSGDETLSFGHQIAFTDIEWKHRLRLSFSGMDANTGQELILYVRDQGSGDYLDTITVESIAGGEFTMDSYAIGSEGSFMLDFYADKNGNGSYDAPPVDQAWRIENVSSVGDHEVEFAYSENFTNIFQTTSVAGAAEQLQLRLYPNPAGDFLRISSEEESGKMVELTVFNATGAVLKQSIHSWTGRMSLDLSDLNEGLYFLQLESGSFRSISRFIKH